MTQGLRGLSERIDSMEKGQRSRRRQRVEVRDGQEQRVDDGGVPAEVLLHVVDDSTVRIALLPCASRVEQMVFASQGKVRSGGISRAEMTLVA